MPVQSIERYEFCGRSFKVAKVARPVVSIHRSNHGLLVGKHLPDAIRIYNFNVGEVAELFECCHLCANWNHLSEYLHFGRPTFDGGAARSRRLEADEDHRILRIRKSLREVMLDASAGHHAAGRNNNARKLILID